MFEVAIRVRNRNRVRVPAGTVAVSLFKLTAANFGSEKEQICRQTKRKQTSHLKVDILPPMNYQLCALVVTMVTLEIQDDGNFSVRRNVYHGIWNTNKNVSFTPLHRLLALSFVE
jgi:hypothetical protein